MKKNSSKDGRIFSNERSRRDPGVRAEMEFGVTADAYRSDPSKRSSRAGVVLLRVAVSMLAGLLALFAAESVVVRNDLFVVCVGILVGLLVFASIHIALDWERCVILRFGRYHRLAGPGLFFTIPLVEYCTLRVDQRTRITPFGAEETLTSDVVPLDVDAVLSWMIWDPEKACTEVEDCCFAVALAAQTALRDAIGRAPVSEVVSRRDQLDREIKDAIEAKVYDWGVTVLSVEIRDIIIPVMLQNAMSWEAQAERRRNARIVLMESERDIAELLSDASEVYRRDDIAYSLRKMHLVHEGMQNDGGTMVVPSSYSEGFHTPSKGERGDFSHSES